jgi:hypothetical protein
MNSIKKWLQNNGFTFKEVMLTDGKSGIMVNTDYDGLYPTRECLQLQQAITVKVKRFKSLKADPRGYRTAVLITEI